MATPETTLRDAHRATHTVAVADGEAEVYVMPNARYGHVALTVVPAAGATYDAEVTTGPIVADPSMMVAWTHLADGDDADAAQAWTLSPAVTAVRVTASGGAVTAYLAWRT